MTDHLRETGRAPGTGRAPENSGAPRRAERPREHEGEQAVQRRAGEGGPDWGTPMFTPGIPAGFVPFFREQHLAAVSGHVPRAGADGDVWCSVLTGDAGFIDPVDDRTMLIHRLPAPGDPLREAYEEPGEFGMVVMSPETLRRVKVNGIARRQGGRLVVHTEQVLGNCPKYLQLRVVSGLVERAADGPGTVTETGALSPGQREMIESADTFFIGSLSPRDGADANHRGGMPGFVTVTGPRTLTWPDYIGNSFYMTLGNLELYPRCGLAFPDWNGGGLLQLTGSARIDWDTGSAAGHPGARRMVEFTAERVVQIERASALRWRLLGYSRVNPPSRHRGHQRHEGAGRA